jgi:hypothetical protein
MLAGCPLWPLVDLPRQLVDRVVHAFKTLGAQHLAVFALLSGAGRCATDHEPPGPLPQSYLAWSRRVGAESARGRR